MKESNVNSIDVKHAKIIQQKLNNLKSLPEIVGSENRHIKDEGDFLTEDEKKSEKLAYALTADQLKFYLYDFTSADNKSLTEDGKELQTEIKKRIILAILASVLIVASITIPILFTNLNIFALLIISMLAFILSVTILIKIQIQSAINNQIDNNLTTELTNALAKGLERKAEQFESAKTTFTENLSSKVNAADPEEFTKNYQEAIALEADADFIDNISIDNISNASNPQLIENIFHAGRSTDIIDALLESVDEQKLSEEFEKLSEEFEKLDQNEQLEIFIHNPIAISNFDKLPSMYTALSTAIEKKDETIIGLLKKLDDDKAGQLIDFSNQYDFDIYNDKQVSDSIDNIRNRPDGSSALRR